MIFKTSAKLTDIGLLIIRFGLGLAFMVFHGNKKIFGGPEVWGKYGKAMNNFGIDFLPVFWGFMAGFAEFVGGFLIIIGLIFRPAAFLLVVTMIVAAGRHLEGGAALSNASRPIEMAVIFIGLLIIGPGKYSLDSLIKNFLEKRKPTT